jgi:DNA-binding GntR family transcriptional regulator
VDTQLVDSLVITILERIADGEIPVGAWLRQERLAQELGVSRMPVREALRQLQALGVVEIVPNRGARVRPPSILQAIEVYELRGLLEAHAGAKAAELITSEQVEQLRRATEAFRQIINDLTSKKPRAVEKARLRWYEANSTFHNIIVEASNNRTLAEVLEGLYRRIPRNLTWVGLGSDVRRLERNAAEHEQIFDAINAGDSERTASLLTAHARHARELLVRALDATASAEAAD